MKTESRPNQSNALANVNRTANLLEKHKGEFAQALASTGVDPGRFLRMCMTMFSENPKLGECVPVSVVKCAMTTALLGLEPGAASGESFWVPFKSNKHGGQKLATHIIGYKGLLKHIYQSRLTTGIQHACVYAGDEFSFEKGSSPFLKHRETAKDCTNDNLTHAWALTKVGGEPLFEVIYRERLLSIRNASRGYNAIDPDCPWNASFPAMCIKTAIRQLAKYLPRQTIPPAILERMHREDKVEFGGADPATLLDAEVTVETPPPPGEQNPPPARPASAPPTSNEAAARLKARVASLLANLPAETASKLLFEVGVDNIETCGDAAKLAEIADKADTLIREMEGGGE